MVLFFALMIYQPALAQQPSAEESVINASKQFDEGFDNADFNLLASIFTDDVVMTSGGGRWQTRENLIGFIKSLYERRPGITLNTIPELVEVGPKDWGVVSERGRWIERWAANGELNELTGSYLAVWRLVDGEWKLAVITIVPVQCSGPYCIR
jgi:ketosteroid isomerase-like protein